ncbi:MAG: hypothetical protein Q9164_003053 [Protoblastenia rupestris]
MELHTNPVDALNSLALKENQSDKRPTASPTKRKRSDSIWKGTAPTNARTRRHLSKESKDSQSAPTSFEAHPTKLGRPRLRHGAGETIPVVRKSAEDVYEVPDDSPEQKVAKKKVLPSRGKTVKTTAKGSTTRSSNEKTTGHTKAGSSYGKEPRQGPKSSTGRVTKKSTTSQVSKTTSTRKKSREQIESSEGEDIIDSEPNRRNGNAESDNEDDFDEQDSIESESSSSLSDKPETEEAESESDGLAETSNADTAEEDREAEQTPAVQAEDASAHFTKKKKKKEKKELLNQDESWKEILKGAKANRKQAGKALLTKTFKELDTAVKDAQRVYEATIITHDEDEERTTDEQINDPTGYLNSIEALIKNVPTSKPAKKADDMICDIYTIIVPHLITLLQRAMTCRVLKDSERVSSSSPYNHDGISEIVLIQQLTINLCSKVIAWRVKPTAGYVISKNLKSKILASLKNMHKAFVAEAGKQKVLDARRCNRLKTLEKNKNNNDQANASTNEVVPETRGRSRREEFNERMLDDVDSYRRERLTPAYYAVLARGNHLGAR